jgi:hypothetical protein
MEISYLNDSTAYEESDMTLRIAKDALLFGFGPGQTPRRVSLHSIGLIPVWPVEIASPTEQ